MYLYRGWQRRLIDRRHAWARTTDHGQQSDTGRYADALGHPRRGDGERLSETGPRDRDVAAFVHVVGHHQQQHPHAAREPRGAVT